MAAAIGTETANNVVPELVADVAPVIVVAPEIVGEVISVIVEVLFVAVMVELAVYVVLMNEM